MNLKKLSYTSLLTVCLLTASCSENEPSANEPSSAAPVSSRASLSVKLRGETAPSANELINSWWIAFADQEGVVSAIVSRDASLSTAVEREEFNVELPAGTYTAYAFANITPQQLEDEAGVSFTVGQAADAGIMSKAWKVMPNNWSKDKPLPMSGFKTVSISTKQPAAPIEIEVIRMVGKVEFSFSNASQKAITVNSVTLGPLATGAVALLPDYSSLGDAPVLPDGLGSEDVTYQFTADAAERTLSVGAENAFSDFFYVRESNAADKPSGHFYVAVNVTREGLSEERLYALTEELTYINRNDYINIPITFTDYAFDVDILFYPPIGGYPAVMTESRDDAFYATFGTQGKFVIRPLIREATEGSAYLQPSQYELTATVTSDPQGILTSTTLTTDPITGELTGELTSKTGSATVKLSVNVKQQDGSVSQTYNKTIYIIRANK